MLIQQVFNNLCMKAMWISDWKAPLRPAIPYRIAVILLDKTYNTLNCTCFTQRWANKSSSYKRPNAIWPYFRYKDLLIRLIAEELIQQYYHQDHHHLKNQTFLCQITCLTYKALLPNRDLEYKADSTPAKSSQYQK